MTELNREFLSLLAQATETEACKIIKQATDAEIKSIIDCLAYRKQLDLPLSSKEKKIIRATKKLKSRLYIIRKLKYILPLLSITFSKLISEGIGCMFEAV